MSILFIGWVDLGLMATIILVISVFFAFSFFVIYHGWQSSHKRFSMSDHPNDLAFNCNKF